jgi:hypothetical protein
MKHDVPPNPVHVRLFGTAAIVTRANGLRTWSISLTAMGRDDIVAAAIAISRRRS